MTAIALASKRGTKRHCQSEPCGLPFYDLNRSPIECPNCGEGYVPVADVPVKTSYSKRPQYKLFKPVEVAEPEEKLEASEDALDETADDSDAIDKVDTLLEIDEDDNDEPLAPGIEKDQTD